MAMIMFIATLVLCILTVLIKVLELRTEKPKLHKIKGESKWDECSK